MSTKYDRGRWAGGLAEWEEGDTCYLSIAFTYKLPQAFSRSLFAKACGKKVVAGGPALMLPKMRAVLPGFVEIRDTYPDAIARHNPRATFASRGCPVGCWFCIVPKLEGETFTLIPDFPVRPILCDNNLSALPDEYQDHIVERYIAAGVPLLDANSGFEPRTFTPKVYARWKPILRGPWRFAYDDMEETAEVASVLEMLRAEPQKRKRVYVLIGNEPFAECMARVQFVIDRGGEPHVQPYMKLTALEREPHVRFDWTRQRLKDVARWANTWGWKDRPFEEYDRFYRSHAPAERYDEQEGLFA